MTEEKQQTDTTEPSELEVCKKQAEEYLNNWKRERADFINYKKDEAKRLEKFVKFANEGLILEMIEILDDLELVAKHENGKANDLELILKKFLDFLKKYEVERIKTYGKFNPELHEAISTEEGGSNIEEVRAGYTMHGKVIRPARVKMVK